VEVKGANAAAFDLATVTLTASKVEPGNQGVGNNVDEFEVEGFVTNVVSVDINTRVAHFFIGATEVRTTSNTEFREGTVDEIVLGAKMSAEGRLENGVLVAKHVKFKASARLEGDIASVTGSGSALTITIQGLPNVTVKTDGLTRLDGIPVQDAHIRVRGRVIGNSTVIATRIELRPADDDVDLQGPVQSINGQTVVILSTQVDTSGFQNDDFEGLNDQPIGRAAFFNAMQVGTLVKVQGRLNGAVVTWREAELED
jgi:cytoskeletal protein CcmA (bactofilin family)